MASHEGFSLNTHNSRVHLEHSCPSSLTLTVLPHCLNISPLPSKPSPHPQSTSACHPAIYALIYPFWMGPVSLSPPTQDQPRHLSAYTLSPLSFTPLIKQTYSLYTHLHTVFPCLICSHTPHSFKPTQPVSHSFSHVVPSLSLLVF